MKTRYIILLLLAFACVSCNKTKRILKQTQYGEKGWEYILENYEDSKKFKFVLCNRLSPETMGGKDSPFNGFEGISANYYRLILDETQYGVYVFFKNGEPRYVCKDSEISDRYFGVRLLNAWDDRSEKEKELERMRFKQGQQLFERNRINGF